MPRRRLTKLQRVRVFDRNEGRCGICGVKIHAERGEKWEIDHIKPLWKGGPDESDNLRPVHKACHRRKSARENPERAKTDRVRATHLGIAKPRSRPMPGGRSSKLKKTLAGLVVERATGLPWPRGTRHT